MLKVLREVRRNKLKGNKIGSYFTYAIGEIILVVIGILIALGINNWNEQNKNRKIEYAYLSDFRNDLITDVKTLEGRISLNTDLINQVDSIFILLEKNESLSQAELIKFIEWNGNLTAESFFIPEKSTIRQFESGTNGNLISNKDLKDKLFRYYSTSERNQNNMEKSIQLYQHQFITKDILSSIISSDVLKYVNGVGLGFEPFDIKNLRSNKDYILSLMSKKLGSNTQNMSYRETIARAKELILILNEELD